MGRRDTSLQVKQILRTTVTDGGKILAQLGTVNDAGTAETDSENADWIQQVGIASRPSLAQPGSTSPAAYAVTVPGGDRDTCIGSQDVRCLDIYGNLAEGETCVFAAGKDGKSQGRVIIKDDGSVTLYTTDTNTKAGAAVALRISPTGGLEFTSQWGSLVLDETGFHVKTKAGPRIDMGAVTVPGVPAALSGAFTGYCTLTAPTVQMAGANNMIGMGPIFNQAAGANSQLMVTGGGPVPLTLADLTAAMFASNTVWISA